ncbi:unnamed protein product [Mesocestoides corti]|uniref:BSD domain-containing protein n=1 Tax=Mesocestoides corti TaxID=53468 RepID=A0A0R3ULN8_MESCO|nr:unnamed protein product [Mesocestoides corti]
MSLWGTFFPSSWNRSSSESQEGNASRLSTQISSKDDDVYEVNIPSLGGIRDVIMKSSSKIAGELKNSAKQLSKAITTSAPFAEFKRIQSEFVAAKTETAASATPEAFLSNKSTDASDPGRIRRIKEQVMHLSLDEQNFLRPPPLNSAFQWSQERADQAMPIAMALLKEDANLAAMRFRLVPRRLKEDDFWRNYFYRISLVQQNENLTEEATTGPQKETSVKSMEDDNIESLGGDMADHPREQSSPSSVKEERKSRPPSLSPTTTSSLSSGTNIDELEAELMLHGGDLDSTVVIDDDTERELLGGLESPGK